MKRAVTKRTTFLRTYDIRKDLKESQLADIGAAALAYNEAEVEIDVLLAAALELDEIPLEVTSRINGVEGKVEIVKAAVATLNAPSEFQKLLADSLGEGGFLLMKRNRDAVVHARDIDIHSAAIATTAIKRGKLYEVLLTSDALKALYDRLMILRAELVDAHIIILKLVTLRQFERYQRGMERGFLASPPQPVIPKAKQRLEQQIPGLIARYREHQNHRQSLPQFPEFPSEEELKKAYLQWVQARLSLKVAAANQPEPPRDAENGDHKTGK
jgi:hypothetical protein